MTNLFLENSIPDLASGLTTKKFTLRDFSQATISVINEEEAKIHAWVEYDLEALAHNSKKLEKSEFFDFFSNSPIRGLPFGVKDIFNTKDFHTQMGSPIWKNFSPGNNARSVDLILDSGGLMVGKTVTAEFAVHALNKTVNPHDEKRTPGTSSSGSAAAVATGMVPFALGTQTAGSIIRPSSFCGVWGMKPSFGLIPRTGVLKTTDSLDTVGFMASHGESLRPLLDSLRVRGPNHPLVYKYIDRPSLRTKKNKSIRKIGFVKTNIYSLSKNYVKSAIENFVKRVDSESDYRVEEIVWPEDLFNAHEVHEIIYNKSLAYYFQNEMKREHEVTPIMRGMIDLGSRIEVAQYLRALEMQNYYSEKVNELFNSFDYVISIATSSSAPDRGKEELPDPSLIWTLCHLPTISAPVFRCPDGMPFGIQILSKKWGDYDVLDGVEELIERCILPKSSR